MDLMLSAQTKRLLRAAIVAACSAVLITRMSGCSPPNPHADPAVVQSEATRFLTELEKTPKSERQAFLSQHQNDVIAINNGQDTAAKEKLAALMN